MMKRAYLVIFMIHLAAVAALAQTGSPPEIVCVEFPSFVQAGGLPVKGHVSFRDPDRDLIGAMFTVKQGIGLGPFNKELHELCGHAEGEFSFELSVEMPQQVTLVVTLLDWEGNASFPVEFSFDVVEAGPACESWDKSFGKSGVDNFDWGYDFQQTNDGGYILVGCTTSYGTGSDDIWLIKTDDKGNKEWDKTFGGSMRDAGRAVQQTRDGGYILVADKDGVTMIPSRDIWLIKTDDEGNKEWDKTFGGSKSDAGRAVQQTRDGGYILFGNTSSYGAGRSDFWLIKTDGAGNEEWKKTFGGGKDEVGSAVQQTRDGGYILFGDTESYGAGGIDLWLIKTDAQGNREWDKTFGGSGGDYGRAVQQSNEGGYILVGYTSSCGAGGADFWLIKTDDKGDKKWDKTFGGIGGDYGRAVQQTRDGGYILFGGTTSYGAGLALGPAESSDFWLIKTDADGNEEWDSIFHDAKNPGWNDFGYAVQEVSGGGYILFGTSGSINGCYGEFWLAKYCPDE